ncbi:MAG: type II secretion system F family protein [Ruminococcaceae bacterium]|nr:type II secretion system F family protein [Oscillospiraceae bacterium]
MAAFTYNGINKQGQSVQGEVIADSTAQAIDRLRENGVIVTEMKEKAAKKKSSGGGKKITVEDVAIVCKQLAVMLSAGVPITRALTTLSKQCANPKLGDIMEEIAKSVEGGMPLSDAFAQYPKVFSPLFVAMVASGEAGGIMEQALVSLGEMLQKEKNLQQNIKSAYSYPRSVGLLSIVLLIAMLWFMVPIFKKMMTSSTEITGISKFIFDASDSLREDTHIWILVAGAIIGAVMLFVKSPIAHKIWENNKLTMPMLGDFMTKMVVARFCRTFATLLAGGVTAVEALKSAGPTSGSEKLEKAVNEAIEDIEEGKSISDALDKSGIFPPMLTGMVAIGEESGALPELLDKVAEFFEEDVENTSRNLRAIIEPIALIFVGVVVGGMLIALYVPMLTASTSIGA